MFGRIRVPPARKVLLRAAGMVSIMGYIIEEHQARVDRISKIQNVQAGRSLVKTVAVAADIKAKQAADDKTNRRLMGYDDHIAIAMVDYDLAYDR